MDKNCAKPHPSGTDTRLDPLDLKDSSIAVWANNLRIRICLPIVPNYLLHRCLGWIVRSVLILFMVTATDSNAHIPLPSRVLLLFLLCYTPIHIIIYAKGMDKNCAKPHPSGTDTRLDPLDLKDSSIAVWANNLRIRICLPIVPNYLLHRCLGWIVRSVLILFMVTATDSNAHIPLIEWEPDFLEDKYHWLYLYILPISIVLIFVFVHYTTVNV